jgi:hypothetical protein
MDKNIIQIIADLGMMVFDQMTCYYTDDGFIAARADYVPAAHRRQIFCIRAGFYYCIKPFKIAHGHWTQVLTRPAEPKDTRNSRDIAQSPNDICGTAMWSGMVNCVQCGNPIIYEEDVIFFRNDTVGLPANCETAVDADTLFKFRVRVAEGRKALGFQLNNAYRVELSSINVMTSSSTTGRRSYRKSGDSRRSAVNLQFGFLPTQVLRSGCCRYAFEKALELGELSRENVGKRNRTAAAANEDDENE